MWSDMRALAVVQAGVLGAAYSMRESHRLMGGLLIGLGVVLTLALYLIRQRNREFRDANRRLVDEVAQMLSKAYCDGDIEPFALSVKPKWFRALTGRRVGLLVALMLVAVDVGMIFWLLR